MHVERLSSVHQPSQHVVSAHHLIPKSAVSHQETQLRQLLDLCPFLLLFSPFPCFSFLCPFPFPSIRPLPFSCLHSRMSLCSGSLSCSFTSHVLLFKPTVCICVANSPTTIALPVKCSLFACGRLTTKSLVHVTFNFGFSCSFLTRTHHKCYKSNESCDPLLNSAMPEEGTDNGSDSGPCIAQQLNSFLVFNTREKDNIKRLALTRKKLPLSPSYRAPAHLRKAVFTKCRRIILPRHRQAKMLIHRA